jgi:hypothetical protein
MSIPPITGFERFVDENGTLSLDGQRILGEITKRLDAIAAISDPTGGGTVDAEARTAIAAIIDAAT